MSRGERKAMIIPAHPDLSLSRQCRLLSISRSSFYYAPRGESPENLTLIRAAPLAATVLFLFAYAAEAAEYRASVLSVYDGDTITVSIEGKVDRVRVQNVDTPEIEGKCESEKKLATKAREFTKAWVGSSVTLITGKRERDQYGRLLANVKNAKDEDLGEALIRARLARKWTGKRQPWC